MSEKVEVAVCPCLCGGEIKAIVSERVHAIQHSLPTCPEYAALETIEDGASFLARVRERLEERRSSSPAPPSRGEDD